MPTHKSQPPVFETLTTPDCWTLLSRNHVGRLAFVNDKLIDIEPVNYAAADGWLFMRSADGSKLEALAHTPYGAFEVDEVDGPFDWRSVVARGTIYVMADDTRHVDRATVDRALAALRSFAPATLADGDPTPLRRTVYGLHVDILSGRSATSESRLGEGSSLADNPVRSSRPKTPDGF